MMLRAVVGGNAASKSSVSGKKGAGNSMCVPIVPQHTQSESFGCWRQHASLACEALPLNYKYLNCTSLDLPISKKNIVTHLSIIGREEASFLLSSDGKKDLYAHFLYKSLLNLSSTQFDGSLAFVVLNQRNINVLPGSFFPQFEAFLFFRVLTR